MDAKNKNEYDVGEEDLRFIEIQIGSILSEDDIERFEDSYGRIVSEES